jgi:hypothetical protein
VTVIMLASIATDLIPGTPDNLGDLLGVGHEANLPTWYSSVSLLLCALLAATIAISKKQAGDPFTPHWWGLAGVFLFLSLDESATIHELLTPALRDAFNTSGFLYFAWVIAGIAFAAAFGAIYIRFLIHLPAGTRWLFLISAAVFLGGAIGVESFNAYLYEGYKAGNVPVDVYNKLTDLEELLEMAGILIFIYALLAYARQYVKRLEIVFED